MSDKTMTIQLQKKPLAGASWNSTIVRPSDFDHMSKHESPKAITPKGSKYNKPVVTCEEVERAVKEKIEIFQSTHRPDCPEDALIVVDVSDFGGHGTKFQIFCASKVFSNVKVIDREKMVRDYLKDICDKLPTRDKGILVKAWTIEQWRTKRTEIEQHVYGWNRSYKTSSQEFKGSDR